MLSKNGSPDLCSFVVGSGCALKSEATVRDIPKKVGKTSSETPTFENHSCKFQCFLSLFLFLSSWGLLGTLLGSSWATLGLYGGPLWPYAGICGGLRSYMSTYICGHMRLYAVCGYMWAYPSTCSHMRPRAAICGHTWPYAAICVPCGHMRPHVATCSHMRPHAAICHMRLMRPYAATCGRLR